MTQALVERFAQEYPEASREEVTAAVEAALAQFARDGLVFTASDVTNNIRTRLNNAPEPSEESEGPASPPTYRSSPRPTIPPPPKPRSLLRRIWDCIRVGP